MNLVWWLILPIIYVLTWITSWRGNTFIEVLLLSFIFIIPLLAYWLGNEQGAGGRQRKVILFYEQVIETGLLLLVSIVPWLLDTRSNDAIFVKTVFVQVIVYTISIIWFLKAIEEGKFRLIKLPVLLPLLAFFWWCIITFITSQYKYVSIEELYRFVSYFLIFLITVNHIKTREQVFRVITTLMITTGIVTIYGIFQHFGYDFVSWASQARIVSSLGNPDFFSGYLCIVIPVSVGLVFASRSIIARVLYAILSFLSILALFWTFTRGGWAAVPVGLIFLIWLILRTVGAKNFLANNRYIYASIAVAIIISGGIAYLFLSPKMRDAKNRLVSTVQFGIHLIQEIPKFVTLIKPYPDNVPPAWIEGGGNHELLEKNGIFISRMTGTAGVRVTIWTGCWRMAHESPFTMIFGQGIGTIRQTFPSHRPPFYRFKTVSHNTEHAHSEYFELLAEQGWVGLGLFLWFVFTFFYKRLGPLHTPDKWKRNLLYGLLAGIFTYLFENLGSVNMRWTSSAPLFWQVMAIAIVCARLPDRAEETNIKSSGSVLTGEIGGQKTKMQKQERRKIQEQPAEKIKSIPVEIKTLAYIGSIVLLIFFYVQITLPFLADIQLRKGVLYRDVPQEWDMAIEAYKKGIKYEPTNIEIPYKLAYIYAQKKEWIEALKTYLGITRLAPNYTQIHYNLGITYYNLGRIDLAIPEFEKTVKLDWSNSVAFFMLGVCYSAKKEFEKALNAFEQAIVSKRNIGPIEGIDPNYPAAHLNKGNIYYRLGRIEEAKKEYEAVLQIEPSNQDAIQRLQWIKEGRIVKWE